MNIKLGTVYRTCTALALCVSALGCANSDHSLGTTRDLNDGAAGTSGDVGPPDAPLGTGGTGGSVGTAGSGVVVGSGGVIASGGVVASGGTTATASASTPAKGGAGGDTGGALTCEATDAGVQNGCSNDSQCPAGQYCDTQRCGSSCSCVGGYWLCTDRCIFSCVSVLTTDGSAYVQQDAAPVTVAIVPGLKTYQPIMSSVPGFPLKPVASGSVPANPLYRWRTDYGTFALWNHSDGKVTDQGSDFAVGDTTVYLEYLTAPPDMSIPVHVHLDLIDGIGGEGLASSDLSLGWSSPATLTVQ